MISSYLAHLDRNGRIQTVEEHLHNTAELSAAFAERFGMEEQGRVVGLAHDIGKCSAAFQERLQGGRIVDHSSAGALECAKADVTALWAACCVAGHHGGLPDVGNPRNDMPGDPTLFGRLRKAINGDIPSYENPVSLPPFTSPRDYGNNGLTDSFIIRMLYSCLVDADYLDTERFMSDGKAEREEGEGLPALLDKLIAYIAPWWNPENELNRKRCEILKKCISGGASPKGLYTLTVPTGGGKTIASMAFALDHAVRHGMDRVIYVIPYTSIIEQTAEVFRGIFGERNVVEHHSNASFEIKENGETGQYSQIKATENWDAPIIVTTAVQFFGSLYANRPAKCRKLHSIANSVIIFDEAQMLPTEHLRPCVAAIASLVKDFGSTAVLCTATQPALNDLFEEYASGMEPTELCPGTTELYEQFRRVTFALMGTVDADTLAEKLAELPQVLCIVNTRKSAQTVFEKLPPQDSYHLSTLMYPAHRRAVLSEIRERLRNGLPCRVVSTSLIEAGVDVDFPAVFREMAGLDSILQAAGRCNREGRHSPEESRVTVFEGVSVAPQLLKVNIGAAKAVLREGVDPAAPETVADYFREYRSLLVGSDLDKYGVIAAFEQGIQGRSFPFRTVAERFRLIDDASKTVFVPLGEGAELVRRLRGGERSRDLFRSLGQFGVNVYERQYRSLSDRGLLEMLDDETAILLDTGVYDRSMGLSLGESEYTACFI